MRIIFLSLLRIEDIGKESSIYADLMRKFAREGHSITIVHPNEKRLGLETQYLQGTEVSYLRVKTGNVTKSNFLEKGIATLMLEFQFKRAISKYLKNEKFDLILYSTPPITFASVIKYLKKNTSAKSYLLLKDIFPQNAVDLGLISKRSPIYSFFKAKELRLYHQSDVIGCMSEANVEYIKKNNDLKGKKVEVCPNSIEITPKTLSTTKKSDFGLPANKVIYVYGGNLGKPQGVEFLKKIILKNEEATKSFICIVGSGTEFSNLQHFFVENKIKNAKLISQLSKKNFDSLLEICDVGLIFLDPRFTIPNFPSRILSYMEYSLPILAATDKVTDLSKKIEEGQFGLWCMSGDTTKFFENMDVLNESDVRQIMGENAYKYLIENYTVNTSYDVIMKNFKGEENV
ncbi:glycosyltransferase family 4 protein [Streptococcus suis]|uniref:glycosyltransferase family 4 protein n=1 Tax=Streptococcus suis TaxID=1307 RepID=UPI000CF63623|nr:glycosyltransferase family 4 protein [Streptococcus suis]